MKKQVTNIRKQLHNRSKTITKNQQTIKQNINQKRINNKLQNH